MLNPYRNAGQRESYAHLLDEAREVIGDEDAMRAWLEELGADPDGLDPDADLDDVVDAS